MKQEDLKDKNNKVFRSICDKIISYESILSFIIQRSQRGGDLTEADMVWIYNSVIEPMLEEYLENPVGKDYIGFNYEIGYFFLSEDKIIRKKSLVK